MVLTLLVNYGPKEKKMTKKMLWRLLTVLILVSLVAACAPQVEPAEEPAAVEEETVQEAEVAEEAEETAAEEPVSAEPKVFNIAIATNIDTFDPHGTRSFSVANVVDYMVETLVNVDETGALIPELAKEWSVSEDGLEITFILNEGVTFSDGTPFNAEAVKYNIERFLDENVQTISKSPYNRIQEVVVVDDTTAKFVLAEPSGELLLAMSNTNIGMISPASVPVDSELYTSIGSNEPIGTGAYVLKEYVEDDHVTVTRNADYWGEAPYYDEVTFRIVPDAATRESLMLAGQVDLAVLPPLTDLAALDANPDVEVIMGNSARLIFIGINTTSEYFDDPRVRQALNYAVDQDTIVEKVMLGNAKPVVSPMPDSFLGFCETEPSYAYNPEKAKELLAEAGVPEGLEIRFVTPSGRYAQDFQVSEAIAGYLTEVGFNVTLDTADWGTYMGWVLAPQEESDYDLYLLGWAGGYPHGAHTMLLMETGQFLNAGYYSNEAVDDFIQSAAVSVDLKESADLYCEANKLIWADAPWIFLYQQGYPIMVKPGITNITILPSEKFEAIYAYPAE
jgi:peptide/nickel transport system substrate-binding protein